MSIEKGRRPNTWLITFYLQEKDENGKIRRAPKRTVHGLKSDAKNELARYKAEYLAGTIDLSPNEQEEDTVGSYARRFHELHSMRSPLAYKREGLEVRHIERMFRGTLLRELDAKKIRAAYARERARRNKPAAKGAPAPLSEDGLHKVHVKLRQILRQAYMDGDIPSNPCDLIEFKKPPQAKKRGTLSLSEARRFRTEVLEAYADEPDAKLVALLIVIATGVRRAEVLGLSWGDVSDDGSVLEIRNQYSSDKDLRDPKADSERTLRVDDATASVVSEWRREQLAQLEAVNRRRAKRGMDPAVIDASYPVISGKYGDRLDPNNFDRFFRNFSVDHGFGKFTVDVKTKTYGGRTITRGKGYQGLLLHELRHTVASLLIADGLDVKSVQVQMGHSSAQTTLNVYSHAFAERSHIAAESLGRLLG